MVLLIVLSSSPLPGTSIPPFLPMRIIVKKQVETESREPTTDSTEIDLWNNPDKHYNESLEKL